MKEIWKDIKGYEGIYSISSNGCIKSISRDNNIAFSKNNSGYFMCVLWKNNSPKGFLLHRLLSIHFIKNHYNKPQVNHKNGIKTDNRIDNLEWVTISENHKHAYDIGLKKAKKGKDSHMYGLKGSLHPKYGMSGEKNPSSKIVMDTETGIYYNCVREASEVLGIKYSTLRSKLNGNIKNNNTSLIYV